MSDVYFEAYGLTARFRARNKVAESNSAVGGRFQPFGNRHELVAVDNVSFKLASGDRLGIIGHNGSGKSTLLKLLSGIIYPTEGRIEYSGKLGNALNTRLGFRPEATGRHNIVLKSLIGGVPKSQIDEMIEDVEDFAELGSFLDMPLSTYSAGMRARLAFGIATAFRYDILMLDEWLGAGDRAMQRKATARMNDFLSGTSITVLASHSERILQTVCNKGMVLEHGKSLFLGSIEDAFAFYNEMEKVAQAPQGKSLVAKE